MSIFKGLISGGIKGLGDTAVEIIKTFKADPNLVLQAEQKIKELENNLTISIEQELTKQIESENIAISERWKADMISDSWLSKNVRPIVLLSSLSFTFLMILTDSIENLKFDVKTNYIDLMQILLITTVAAYFGGRTIEKYKKTKELNNDN